ncbi:peptidoglycan/xylan/chitin deacetylase (PgdA/CDA1 family) [Bradyrhizobium sp. RT9a]
MFKAATRHPSGHDLDGRCLHGWTLLLVSATTAVLAGVTAAGAADCPRNDALGTSRVLVVDAKTYPRVGLKSFPQTLPLADHEVVLTFDDGPQPPYTEEVLAALAQECVRVTFFLVGKSSAQFPELVRHAAAQGHTIAHHTWSHSMASKISFEKAKEDIDRGIAADEMALHGVSTIAPSTPFFRFPYFDLTPKTLKLLQSRGIVVFGADLWASDWEEMTPDQELKLITSRLNAEGRGIILFHDAKAHTAAMMPAFLRYLHDNGYHVVHIVPTAPLQRNAVTH